MHCPDSRLCNLSILDWSQFVEACRKAGKVRGAHGTAFAPRIALLLLMAVALDIVLMGFPIRLPVAWIPACPVALCIGLVLQVVRIGQTTGNLPQASTLALASWIAAVRLSGNLRCRVECPRATCAPSSGHRILQRGRCPHGKPGNPCHLPLRTPCTAAWREVVGPSRAQEASSPSFFLLPCPKLSTRCVSQGHHATWVDPLVGWGSSMATSRTAAGRLGSTSMPTAWASAVMLTTR
ncbi:hypothetical protein ABID77_003311 [Variovorax sp. PvP013]